MRFQTASESKIDDVGYHVSQCVLRWDAVGRALWSAGAREPWGA